jgi:hypothetical protein
VPPDKQQSISTNRPVSRFYPLRDRRTLGHPKCLEHSDCRTTEKKLRVALAATLREHAQLLDLFAAEE